MIHELGHILGLAHTSDVKSVMFPTVDCSAKITEEMKQTLRTLYSIEALPDLYFSNIETRKTGEIIEFNFTVSNRGLITTSKNVSVEVKVNDKIVGIYDTPSLEAGFGWITWHAIQIEENSETVIFIIDSANSQKELNRENNIIILKPV